MRTTLVIHDGLMREAKRAAVETGQTLSAVFENALRIALARRAPSAGRRVRLPVSRHSGGVRPGVDLDDGSALLNMMEEEKPVPARR
jgi:hypothetical protein